jgi:hypothetical protein
MNKKSNIWKEWKKDPEYRFLSDFEKIKQTLVLDMIQYASPSKKRLKFLKPKYIKLLNSNNKFCKLVYNKDMKLDDFIKLCSVLNLNLKIEKNT